MKVRMYENYEDEPYVEGEDVTVVVSFTAPKYFDSWLAVKAVWSILLDQGFIVRPSNIQERIVRGGTKIGYDDEICGWEVEAKAQCPIDCNYRLLKTIMTDKFNKIDGVNFEEIQMTNSLGLQMIY